MKRRPAFGSAEKKAKQTLIYMFKVMQFKVLCHTVFCSRLPTLHHGGLVHRQHLNSFW